MFPRRGMTIMWGPLVVDNFPCEVQRCVWQRGGPDWTQNFKKFLLKSTPTFLLFILYQSLFITIQLKKSLQNKIFHFFIQNLLTFFFFSYINQIYYNTGPLPQAYSFAKHSPRELFMGDPPKYSSPCPLSQLPSTSHLLYPSHPSAELKCRANSNRLAPAKRYDHVRSNLYCTHVQIWKPSNKRQS
jgi:hypothetical protein